MVFVLFPLKVFSVLMSFNVHTHGLLTNVYIYFNDSAFCFQTSSCFIRLV